MKNVKCPRCGLVAFASVTTCKRCGGALEATSSLQVQSEESDITLVRSVKTRQSVILGLGFMGTLALGIAAAVNTEDTTRMAVLFVGIVLVGFLSTWVVASIVKSRMLAGRNDFVQTITAAQKSAVLTSSLLCAFIVFRSDYGFIISPLIVLLFNGALYLYEHQMKSTLRAREARPR